MRRGNNFNVLTLMIVKKENYDKMKKVFLSFLIVLGICLFAGCKSGVSNENINDSTIAENRIYDIIAKGDTLLIIGVR